MTNKRYSIFLNGNKIGTTYFEKADAPMGVVFGCINLVDIASGYDFFENYCLENNIEFTYHYLEDKFTAVVHLL